MAKNESGDEEIETTYSGEFGRRNRSTPGRTPGELGLDPEEMRGHSIAGPPDRFDAEQADAGGAIRKSPAQTPDVEQLGTGGLSQSGGRAGGERGNAGTSDDGAGGPEGESRGGPGQYKSTSRGDLDRGSD